MKKLSNKEIQKLVELANKAKKKAYAPYSNFPVGAALLTNDGKIYAGCNVENASYGLTNCAERTTIFSAILHQTSPLKITAIAITSNEENFLTPCGACRQVIAEFVEKDADVILSTKSGILEVVKFSTLFPTPPKLKHLSKK